MRILNFLSPAQRLRKWYVLSVTFGKHLPIVLLTSGTQVYERGVASIGTSADLWTNYCGFKVETNHDSDAIRE